MIDLFKRTQVRSEGVGGALKKLLTLPRPYLGMTAAHLGLAIVALGVLGAGVWRTEEILFMNSGDRVTVGGYTIILDDVAQMEGPNYITETAGFTVFKGEKELRRMETERRYYPVRGMQTTEAGIWTSPLGDLYLTIGVENADEGHAVRAWYNPFAVWLWVGGAMMAFGGVVAASPQRKRRESMSAAEAKAETAT